MSQTTIVTSHVCRSHDSTETIMLRLYLNRASLSIVLVSTRCGGVEHNLPAGGTSTCVVVGLPDQWVVDALSRTNLVFWTRIMLDLSFLMVQYT